MENIESKLKQFAEILKKGHDDELAESRFESIAGSIACEKKAEVYSSLQSQFYTIFPEIAPGYKPSTGGGRG
jgi:hypothetical protein